MKSLFTNVPVEEIELLQRQAMDNLQKALLEGASWKELRAQRALVTELSIIIEQRKLAKTLPIENEKKANLSQNT